MDCELTLFHWGLAEIDRDLSGAPILRAWSGDRDPSPIGLGESMVTLDRARVRRPSIRRSLLEQGPGAERQRRGSDPFVEISWSQALDIVAAETRRVIDNHGNEAIFGGSYGWASAGRFHHALSQLKRFLNTLGGFVGSRDSYSLGAGAVVMRHVVGTGVDDITYVMTSWELMIRQTKLFVTFGGVPLKNAQVSSAGAAGAHRVREKLDAMRKAGVRFINISPVRSDLDAVPEAEWIPIRPNTDTALMLAVCYVLETENLANRDFLARYTEGIEIFRRYLLGEEDGQPKTPAWAEHITGVPADRIKRLAGDMAGHRTMLNTAWSLQRASHGEQPFWALATTAAMLGQIGLPGGGFGLGYGSLNSIGTDQEVVQGPSFPQGENKVKRFIPVARLVDMLEKPGETFSYDGRTHRYPDIRMVFWAGGNPFHHHQDINRLRAGWQKPETIVVFEPYWTATARHADIVLPAATPLERNDLGFGRRECFMLAMRQARPPLDESRSDFEILADLAQRLGVRSAFTEGLDEMGWLRRLYDEFRQQTGNRVAAPDFDTFWRDGLLKLPQHPDGLNYLGDFRANPEAHRLPTPSGKIEIFSRTIAGFGLADCKGHPCWLEPNEWLGAPEAGRFPLHMLSDQPERRLHSQLDHSDWSRASKIDGREPIVMNVHDAANRGISAGDVVRVFNARGECLAGAVVATDIAPGVVKLSTGAWYDPLNPENARTLDKHGNPNVLTRDEAASSLSQGCSAQSCLVEVERYDGTVAEITAHDPPPMVRPSNQLRE